MGKKLQRKGRESVSTPPEVSSNSSAVVAPMATQWTTTKPEFDHFSDIVV